MNAILSMTTLLLGAVALPDFNPGTDQSAAPETAAPQSAGPAQQSPAVPLDQLRVRAGGFTSRGGSGAASSQGQFVPMAPTDPGLASPDSPWAAPTEGAASGVAPGFGTRARGSSSTLGRRPTASAGASARAPSRAGSPAIAQQAQASRLEAMSGAGQVGKPFTGYTPPPTTSPYMNLYRGSSESYNNYTELVRPAVDQQRQNQSFGGQIRGLQSSSRLQSMGLQRLGKAAGQRGTNAPEFYMNYGTYYPAFMH
jgi:hypothetical protein